MSFNELLARFIFSHTNRMGKVDGQPLYGYLCLDGFRLMGYYAMGGSERWLL